MTWPTSPYVLGLIAVVGTFTDFETGFAMFSIGALAAKLKVSTRRTQYLVKVLEVLGVVERVGLETDDGQRFRWLLGYAEGLPLSLEEQLDDERERAAELAKRHAEALAARDAELEALRAALALRDATPAPLAQRPDDVRPAATAETVPVSTPASCGGVHTGMQSPVKTCSVCGWALEGSNLRLHPCEGCSPSPDAVAPAPPGGRPAPAAAPGKPAVQTFGQPAWHLNPGEQLEERERKIYLERGGPLGLEGDWTMIASLHVDMAGRYGVPLGELARILDPWWAEVFRISQADDARFVTMGRPMQKKWIDRHLARLERAVKKSLAAPAASSSPPSSTPAPASMAPLSAEEYAANERRLAEITAAAEAA